MNRSVREEVVGQWETRSRGEGTVRGEYDLTSTAQKSGTKTNEAATHRTNLRRMRFRSLRYMYTVFWELRNCDPENVVTQ